MQSYKEKYGQWALVLGATEGIGRAGAIELAHRGMDIILVGRREDKLLLIRQSVANSWKSVFPLRRGGSPAEQSMPPQRWGWD